MRSLAELAKLKAPKAKIASRLAFPECTAPGRIESKVTPDAIGLEMILHISHDLRSAIKVERPESRAFVRAVRTRMRSRG